MTNLRNRILLIVGLLVASGWALFPRTVVERVKRDGQFTYDTLRRVPLKRGLDLQGGMHLALEVDESRQAVANKSEALDRALKVVRTRIDEFGVSEPVVQKAGDDRIIVELPGIDDPQRATDVVQRSAFLQFQITDESQAFERVLPRLDQVIREQGAAVVAAAPAAGPGVAAAKPADAVAGLFAKADSGTAKDTSKQADSTSTIPGLGEGRTGPLSKLVSPGGMPGEYLVAAADAQTAQRYLELPAVVAAMPPGKVVKWGTDSVVSGQQVFRPLYMLDSKPILTGEYLTDAKPNQVPVEGTVVEFQLNNEGGRRFKNETGKHVKDYMAIVLDDRVMGRPPVIQSAIGTRGQITLGGRDLQAAQDLALVLRAGALPVPLRVAEVRNIGASLGQDSIEKGILAMGIAMALVVAIMVFYYRFSGMLAVGALVLYVVYSLAVLAGFGAVLTLPGIAGLVLSVGIAVDANVLIFERIREELDRGKTVRLAIEEGFNHALSAIVDTSVATILTAAVLYQYGTGPIRGFAVTLIAGITASLFCAVFVVKTFYLVWLSRKGATPSTLSI
ncbi:MAG: protein translocase subunit SecD [Gemmatimonadota bacterium]|jgi:preprotein translocase subunit SecD|nr:protein translocase subunit SecD [Gemmatimonadota bacterium]